MSPQVVLASRAVAVVAWVLECSCDVKSASEISMPAQAVAVLADVYDVAVMYEPVDQCRRHYVVPEAVAQSSRPFLDV